MALHVLQANQHLKTEKRKDSRSLLPTTLQTNDTNATLDAQPKKNRQVLVIKNPKSSYMENEHHKSTMSPSSGTVNQPFIINTNKFDVKVDVDNLEYDSDEEKIENDSESSEQIEIELKDEAYINSHTVIDKGM